MTVLIIFLAVLVILAIVSTILKPIEVKRKRANHRVQSALRQARYDEMMARYKNDPEELERLKQYKEQSKSMDESIQKILDERVNPSPKPKSPKPKSAAGAMVKGAVVGGLIGGDAGAVVGAMVGKEKYDAKNKE